jgi:putative DNA-invertase from lambdoid prophage Rac
VATRADPANLAQRAPPERAKVQTLARAREIEAILVTEPSRWGRGTQRLVQSLEVRQGWKVSVPAQTGLSFELGTVSGTANSKAI